MLHMRRGKRDNLGIIFHCYFKTYVVSPALELSRRDDSNEESQHAFTEKLEK